MSSKETREFLARKLKAVVSAEMKDMPATGKWSADNHNQLAYLDGTVADAYSLYKRLTK